MAALHSLKESCRRDSNTALTVAGVAFWVLLTASLLGGHAVASLMAG